MYSLEHSSQLPTTIAESIAQIKTFALQEFEREIVQKQLYYHTRDHVNNVQRRANQIFQVVCPYWTVPNEKTTLDISRMKLLLDLCAIAHDMVQVFVVQTQAHTPRARQPGVSEMATIDRLLDYINQLNQQFQKHAPTSPARLTDQDISIIRDAIAATICAYDHIEQAIYQPDLYHPHKSLSPVARILALADIGALGIDGVEVYHQEGSLLVLEENLDLIPLILDGTIYSLGSNNSELYQNIQKRLLNRCRFQVNFAKSRFARLEREIADFPDDAISTLTNEVFKHLNPTTIQEVEAKTPTHENTTLEELLQFFEFERYLKKH
ncbi:MAG: hypothetical protein KME05_17810 [Gloeocapsa sp. UFS-A4-WI-NPMV-4B04]|nr:hypothetical protein [Gloeocapsa sp. UFS-A4-WI-NPMV-4B04]